jgi:nicotinamidase-related amidase
MTDATSTIDPQRAILLVMDYQPAILANVPDLDGLLKRAARAIGVARASGMAVGYVRVAFTDADYEAAAAANPRFAAMGTLRRMDDGTPETAVHPAVAPGPGDIEVRKTRHGAFSTTDLDRQLRERGIDTLVLAGVSTSGVLLSTVRDASDRDYTLYVLEDACADRDPEVHDVLMHKVFPRQDSVISVAHLSGLVAAR